MFTLKLTRQFGVRCRVPTQVCRYILRNSGNPGSEFVAERWRKDPYRSGSTDGHCPTSDCTLEIGVESHDKLYRNPFLDPLEPHELKADIATPKEA